MSDRSPTSLDWKVDCRYFRGDRPCEPHRREGVHCDGCPHYERVETRILIIKLGAVGDVIRTTPILAGLRRRYPASHITWVTDTPAVIPASVDRVATLDPHDLLAIEATPYTLALNLDKDPAACALARRVQTVTKHGFILEDGVQAPADDNARHKFLTGIFDDVSKANRKSYVEEIFEIAGLEWQGEEYELDRPDPTEVFGLNARRPRVGLNTGCGGRWPSRLWPEEHWVDLANELARHGVGVVLLGGLEEDERNQRLAARTGVDYPGHFPLSKFMALVDQVDLVVTAVTMAMHIAIGLKKQLVLFNNIFNRHEFELYGRGEILEPSITCDCYYRPVCEKNCMQYIEPPRAASACMRLLGLPEPAQP